MVLVHEPWEPTPDSNGKGGLLPCVEYLDKEIGKLLRGLDDLGLRDNTVVLFMGDNGTGQDGKGTVTERGVRVPMIVSGPGIRKGYVSRELIDCSDVLPTIAELAGARLPNVPIDGRSFAWELQGKRGQPREWIFSYLAYERMLRDRRWLLEGNGKFYDCGESRDGTGYRDVTVSTGPEVVAARRRFAGILEKLPAPPPEPGEQRPVVSKSKL
jgi:arylsulfatase A